MNPSAEDILAAVESVPSSDVVLLPNNGNVIMTAQQVAELTKKHVRVVPSRSLPQGIAALFAFDFSAGLEANATAMSRALGTVQTIEVTRAVRASEVDGLKIAENDVIGLLDDRIVDAGPSPERVAQAVLKRIDAGKVGTVTIYAGVDASDEDREGLRSWIAKQFPDASVELQSGEQALYPYVLAVACDEPVGFQTGAGRRREEAALVEAFVLSDRDWQRLSMSEGTKGPRLFDWAIIPMLHQWEDDGRHWLLIRRSLTDPNEKAYYFVFAPKGTTLPEMVKAIGARWHVEENFENGKDLGIDHYEVRSFIGWYRHYSECSFVTVRIMSVIRE